MGPPKTAALVVEIAVTTPTEDREMIALYAEAAVTEFWLVLAKEQATEVYSEPEAGQYRKIVKYGLGDTFRSLAVGGMIVSLGPLFESEDC